MDPSQSLIVMRSSFRQLLFPVVSKELEYYKQEKSLKITLSPLKISIDQINIEPIYCDINKYRQVKNLNMLELSKYIGLSIFYNKNAVKLANIDTVCNVTRNVFTFDKKQSDDEFEFIDIGSNGGFTEYLQFRYPKSKGYGVTSQDWELKNIDMNRFTLLKDYKIFQTIKDLQLKRSVDLVAAYEVSDNEILSSKVLINEILIAMKTLKIGGNFLVRVFDTLTNITAQIVFILSQCFQKILIFIPISGDNEKYIICKDFNGEKHYKILKKAIKLYSDKIVLTKIFKEQIPDDFKNWLIKFNNQSLDKMLESQDLTLYNFDKLLTIWNLPDTPLESKNSKIKIIF